MTLGFWMRLADMPRCPPGTEGVLRIAKMPEGSRRCPQSTAKTRTVNFKSVIRKKKYNFMAALKLPFIALETKPP